MPLNVFYPSMRKRSVVYLKFMRAETKPPGGFVLSPEIPAASDSMVMFRTLGGFAGEKSGKFPG